MADSTEQEGVTGSVLRLFFAVSVPEALQGRLRPVLASLGPDWRPVCADQMHITLAFLGSVPEESLVDVQQAGEAVAAAHGRFSVRLGPSGVFPERGSPRVLFLHLEAQVIMELASCLRQALRRWVDPKPFRAHLTLARAKGPAAAPVPLSVDGMWEVAAFQLLKSTLTGSGAEHRILETYPLLLGGSSNEEGGGTQGSAPR